MSTNRIYQNRLFCHHNEHKVIYFTSHRNILSKNERSFFNECFGTDGMTNHIYEYYSQARSILMQLVCNLKYHQTFKPSTSLGGDRLMRIFNSIPLPFCTNRSFQYLHKTFPMNLSAVHQRCKQNHNRALVAVILFDAKPVWHIFLECSHCCA